MHLQDDSIDIWSRRIARNIIKFGNLVFHALEEGLKSKIKRISCDCLTAIALLGREIAKCPDSVRYPACEILLSGIEQFLHPGFELEERLLACYCIYNYTSHIGNSLSDISEYKISETTFYYPCFDKRRDENRTSANERSCFSIFLSG